MKFRPMYVLFVVFAITTLGVASLPRTNAARSTANSAAIQRMTQISVDPDEGGLRSNPYEVGVEWITDWPGTANDRANWYYSANDFYNEMRDEGWVGRFNYGNDNSWERDYKLTSLGGLNDQIIDNVDITMLATHGSSAYDSRYNRVLSSAYFSNPNQDDLHITPGEARRAYGNRDLEWIAFDSCSVLRDDSMWYWYQTFDGLHLMLGFANTMYVVYRGNGGVWGDQMRSKGWWVFGHPARTVTQAWFTAVEDEQPSGVRARVLAETLDSYNDYIWGEGYVSPDYPNNGTYWYWDHVAGTPDPLQLQQQEVPESVPTYQVVDRTVDEEYIQSIGNSFGLTSTVLISPEQDLNYGYMVGGENNEKQLRIDLATGGYFYQDLGQLWTDPETPRNLPGSEKDALNEWNTFRGGEGEILPGIFGSQFYTVVSTPTIELEGPTEGLQEGVTVANTTPTSPTNYAIHYMRTVSLGSGYGDVSVVGPGSRLNVYIGNEDNAGHTDIIGVKGGWRDIGEGAQIQNVAIENDPEVVWDAFLDDPNIALALPPVADSNQTTVEYDRTGKPAPTLGYYEHSLSMEQDELIPVWIFVADISVETDTPDGPEKSLVAADADIYVPAESGITPLGAKIDDSVAGQLTGAATGGTPPYTYEWYSSVEGPLSEDGTTLDISGLDTSQPNTITFVVIDANANTATVEINIGTDDKSVPAKVYVPLVIR